MYYCAVCPWYDDLVLLAEVPLVIGDTTILQGIPSDEKV